MMEDIINTVIKRKGKTVAMKWKHDFIKQLYVYFACNLLSWQQETLMSPETVNYSRNYKNWKISSKKLAHWQFFKALK